MSIALLATGDELIQGDTLNTTSHAIAHSLNSEGLPLGLHVACGDKEHQLVDCLEFLSKNHAIIILTGGLGPTSDDLTRFALARFLNISLIEYPQAIEHIQARLTRANLSMNAGNRQQAFFPPDATLLPNPHGTAMGCYCTINEKLFILLPGPPRECLPMFNQYVLPVLQQTQHHEKQLLKWRLFGVAEGEIAQILDEALVNSGCETGYRLETPYVEFKVRCHAAQIAMVRQIIEPLVKAHVIAPPEEKASERLRALIAQLPEPIVIIDDATGGLLQMLLQHPENYQKAMFHENEEIRLRFHVSGLEEYWLKHAGNGKTQIKIDYESEKEHGSEVHQIPYRSPLVIDYAAEWLSFRLFHLINQLHQRVA